jgi:hypothetical protein
MMMRVLRELVAKAPVVRSTDEKLTKIDCFAGG